MDIEQYLRKKANDLAKNFKRIRDLRVFDFSYVPEHPILRDEIKPVIDALLRYEASHIGNHLLITGSRGSGKTLSMLYLRKEFEGRGLSVLYSNCRIHNTSYKILADLLNVRARGVSFSELSARFSDRYPGQTVVVLDEIDLLADRNCDILYFLSRSPCAYMAVLLSNNPRWDNVLDDSVQSTLQPERIYFRPYAPSELEKILNHRAKQGMGGVSSEVIRYIAALTAKYANSDVRVALKTMYYWATEPESSLDENFHRARRDIVFEVLKSLSDKNLLILKSSCGTARPVKEVYETYRRLCRQHHEEPFSYVYVYSCLAYLQSLGLIVLSATKIHRTYTKLIETTFPTEMLTTIWDSRFR